MLTYRQQSQLAKQSKAREETPAAGGHCSDTLIIALLLGILQEKKITPTQHLVCMPRLMASHTKNYGKAYHFQKKLPKREGWHWQVLADVSKAEGMDWDCIVANA